MAITFDSAGSALNANNDGTVQSTITPVSSTNTILIAYCAVRANTISMNSAPKFAGTNLTQLITGSAANLTGEIWYLLSPPTGLGTFQGTWSASSTRKETILTVYTGINQTVPIFGSVKAVGTAASGSIANTSLTANNWEVSMFYEAAAGPGTANTGNLRGTVGEGFSYLGASDSTGGTLRWTLASTVFVILGGEINTGGPVVNPRLVPQGFGGQ